jgi:chromosome condensin MukBEF complex kleisin-like MukF subunit
MYLAAMSRWDHANNEGYLVANAGYTEEACLEIFSYVDRWLDRNDGNAVARGSNFLKRAIEQGLVMLAGASLSEVSGVYRLTQMTQDLLKPFTGDPLEQQETLGQRYLKIEIMLSDLNMLSVESDQEWHDKVKASLPSFRDLMEGINKNQEQLILGYALRRQKIQEMHSVELSEQIESLISLVSEIAEQISDLKTVILSGADKVLFQIHDLTEKGYQRQVPEILISALNSLYAHLDSIREFSSGALLELADFFERLLDTIRLRISLNQNANMSLLIEHAVQQHANIPWSLAILAPEALVELREWEPPPPPEDQTLPMEGNEDEVIRDTPSAHLELLAKKMTKKILGKGKEVEVTKVARKILKNELFSVVDRHRLLFFVVNQLLEQGHWAKHIPHPEWICLDDAGNIEIEQQWLVP